MSQFVVEALSWAAATMEPLAAMAGYWFMNTVAACAEAQKANISPAYRDIRRIMVWVWVIIGGYSRMTTTLTYNYHNFNGFRLMN
jgi:hypothetical protein